MTKSFYVLIIVVSLYAVALWAYQEHGPPQVIGNVGIHVLAKNTDGITTFLVVESIVMPRFTFRVEQGLVGEDKLMLCKQIGEWRKGPQGVLYPVLVLECEHGLRMVMTEVGMTSR